VDAFSEARSTFDRARRRRAYRRLAGMLGGTGGERPLLDFEEAERRLRPSARRYLGVRPIPLRQVVGTDSRGRDFDREFLPLRRELRQRWRRVEQAFPHGDFPPVVVSKLGDAYFVIDGHHRVAIARQQGAELIDAEVTELRARWHLHADADPVELVHAEQYRIFMERSGLAVSRPDVCVSFSRPVGYLELLDHVRVHGYDLMLETGEALAPREIAADWYDRIYVPALDSLRSEGLHPRWTTGDLFLCVSARRRELLAENGSTTFEDAARKVLEGDARRGRGRSSEPARR
jgi:hypothetical protein